MIKKVKLIVYILITQVMLISSPKGHTSVNESSLVNILMPAPFAESTKSLIIDFNKNNSDFKIKITKGPLETEAVSDLAISSFLLGNSPYDLILLDVTWLAKYAEAGWLSPLSEFSLAEEWSGLSEGAKIGNKYKGILYRWPLVADIGLLYWRTDLMDKPPSTLNELIKISSDLQKQGKVKYGYAWQGRQYEGLSCVFLEVLSGIGGTWLDNKGMSNLDSSESLLAIQWLYSLIERGISPKAVANFSESEALQAFETGNYAFMRNWPYAWKELQKSTSLVKGKVDITTMVSLNGNKSSATLGSWGLSIVKSSRNKNNAYKALRYLTSLKSQKYLLENSGYTPTSTKILGDKELNIKYPILKKLRIALSKSVVRPQSPVYAQISSILQKQLNSVFTGKIIPRKASIQAHIKTNKVLLSVGDRL